MHTSALLLFVIRHCVEKATEDAIEDMLEDCIKDDIVVVKDWLFSLQKILSRDKLPPNKTMALTEDRIDLTPEVKLDDKCMYLIRVNGEEVALANDEHDAVLIVDSFAAHEQKRLESEWTKVFREDLKDGKKAVISTQTLGRVVNGYVCKAVEVDCVPVYHAILIRGRHEADDIPVPPPIPTPEVLEQIARRVQKAVTSSGKAVSSSDDEEVDLETDSDTESYYDSEEEEETDSEEEEEDVD